MAGPLQSFDFRDSRYNRPTQKWVCGWAAKGEACHVGPDHKGNCVATSECQPIRNGDRWMCTRSEIAGGRCTDGPMPDGACACVIRKCAPVRSIRARRGLFARVVSALTVGLVLIFVFGPSAHKVISPGALTQQHAEVIDCGTCHAAFPAGPTGWIRAAFSAAPNDPATSDSGRCLKCHAQGDSALNPHSQDAAMLTKMRKRAHPPSKQGTEPLMVSLASGGDPGAATAGKLACATCHREHQGRNARLASMSDARCQACHTARFAGLDSGHPEFDHYPYKRRTRLIFDHIGHIEKHFKDKKFKQSAPDQCTTCHSPDAAGNTMLVNGYKTCMACHAAQIVTDGGATPVFAVPGIDAQTLHAKGAPIGAWPEDAEAELTPFMVLLLSGDPDFRDAWNTVRELNLLDDLEDADAAQIKAAQTVAWSVKRLIQDLRAKGGAALGARIETALGSTISGEDLAHLAGRLPVDLIANARREWFPDLDAEMKQHRAGVPVPTRTASDDAPRSEKSAKSKPTKDTGDILAGGDKKDTGDILAGGDKKDTGDILAGGDKTVSTAPVEENVAETGGEIDANKWTSAGGWYRDQFTLLYRPTGHADDFLRSWMDLTGASDSNYAKSVFASLTARQAVGRCAKCHSSDKITEAALKPNWVAARPVKEFRKFTGFSHAAHSKLFNDKACLGCHVRDDDSKYLDAFKNNDPAVFQSNFKPMERQTCARCHTPQLAAESCVLCHQYHVGSFPPAITAAPMTIPRAGERPRP